MTAWPIMAVASFPITAARSYLQIRPPPAVDSMLRCNWVFASFALLSGVTDFR